MPKSKRGGQSVHARRRALERYGLSLSGKDLQAMVHQIQRHEAKPIGKATNRITLFYVTHEGIELPVAYDRLRHSIATVLPPDPVIAEYQGYPEYYWDLLDFD